MTSLSKSFFAHWSAFEPLGPELWTKLSINVMDWWLIGTDSAPYRLALVMSPGETEQDWSSRVFVPPILGRLYKWVIFVWPYIILSLFHVQVGDSMQAIPHSSTCISGNSQPRDNRCLSASSSFAWSNSSWDQSYGNRCDRTPGGSMENRGAGAWVDKGSCTWSSSPGKHQGFGPAQSVCM
jgi:hypothetical protein